MRKFATVMDGNPETIEIDGDPRAAACEIAERYYDPEDRTTVWVYDSAYESSEWSVLVSYDEEGNSTSVAHRVDVPRDMLVTTDNYTDEVCVGDDPCEMAAAAIESDWDEDPWCDPEKIDETVTVTDVDGVARRYRVTCVASYDFYAEDLGEEK